MKHRRGINLVRNEPRPPAGEGDWGPTEHLFRIEVWDHPPEAGDSLLETISRSTDFNVSMSAFKEALRQRPGKYLVHLNGSHRMSGEKAQDPPPPLSGGRPCGGSGRIQADRGRSHASVRSGGMVRARRAVL